ncbi:hypothetical protein KEX41_18525 [Burkholderia thailandensis]|uniref:hypothetical protein n=1 Tax=Burkholderia thailandensis TaxID=57975 RepID=UPI000A936038|nr:hypothetical protein [Burkholderia thailandensis]MBS2130202.1 hypothetical protein [Burkholderia thailandensis]
METASILTKYVRIDFLFPALPDAVRVSTSARPLFMTPKQRISGFKQRARRSRPHTASDAFAIQLPNVGAVVAPPGCVGFPRGRRCANARRAPALLGDSHRPSLFPSASEAPANAASRASPARP